MKFDYKDVIYLIATGCGITFTLIVYAHANFTTKDMVDRLEKSQETKDVMIIKRLDRIENKLDKLAR